MRMHMHTMRIHMHMHMHMMQHDAHAHAHAHACFSKWHEIGAALHTRRCGVVSTTTPSRQQAPPQEKVIHPCVVRCSNSL
jgi:hypothetical protein